jgi:hypothetical protein
VLIGFYVSVESPLPPLLRGAKPKAARILNLSPLTGEMPDRAEGFNIRSERDFQWVTPDFLKAVER